VPKDQDASVSSGLEALKILDFNGEEKEVLPGTGIEISEFAMSRGEELVINAISRIIPGQMCRTFSEENGQEMLRFPFTNRYFKQLEVSSRLLNTIWSVTGDASPASVFDASTEELPDDYYGFEWPISNFTWIDSDSQEKVSAIWRILGKQVTTESLRSEIPFCSEPDSLIDCNKIPVSLRNRIFEQAVSTVSGISRGAVKAKKTGRWKPKGKFRLPYLIKRAADALSSIRGILQGLPRNHYVCSTPARPPCQQQKFPKASLLLQFENILKVKLPPELKHLRKKYPAERKAFIQELNKYPDTFTSCPE